jgi:uncharacterized protein YprB with RNaseH-like and TPR domain
MTTSDDRTDKLARLERLRKLGVQRGAHGLNTPAPTPERAVAVAHVETVQTSIAHSSAPAVLPGEPGDTPHGPAWVRTVRYSLAERPDLDALLHIEPEALAAAGRDSALAALDPARAAFIDTETTGLTPDTGTYTFLIGVGTYELPVRTDLRGLRQNEGSHDLEGLGEFVVRQFFMRHPGEERAQLHLVEEALAHCTGIISFNGRGFDLPMLQNRFILARRPFPWIRLPHFDLLPASRRVWRDRLESCRLGSLEEHILGVQRSEEDVPGYLIPDIYRQYYLSGVVTDMLVRVFYHNLIDITSMPLLAARLGQLYHAAGLEDRMDSLHPAERASLARAYIELGWIAAGERAYHAALAAARADAQRAQLYRDLGFLLKRLARREEAVALWEEWIGAVPGEDVTPYIELAKHHEWHIADLAAARGWTAWAVRIAEGWPPGYARDATLLELQHRLARIERKLGGGSVEGSPPD